MVRNLRLAICALACIGFAMSFGCEAEEQWPPPTTKSKTKKDKPDETKAPEDKESLTKSTEQFSYNPVGKRDPFRSYLSVIAEQGDKKLEREIEKTELFELDQYKLVALISGTSQPRAMVEDPNREGHIIRIGSRLGKNGGRITRISNNSVVVVEEFRAPTGERIRVPITVKLPQESELAVDGY